MITRSCLPDYHYFQEINKLIATDLSKQEALDADPKAIRQINFPGNLERKGNAEVTMYAEATTYAFGQFFPSYQQSSSKY